MDRILKLVGKTSNEIFTLRYPTSLLDFCEFDFSYFAKHSIELCNESLKKGTFDPERAAELRKELCSAHSYIEHHIRTVYEKTVLDCWIDYVCRRDNISVGQLWNRFIHCANDFEKIVFSRLCDLRYNRSINVWLNIVRVQDYARRKTDFIFLNSSSSIEEAVARRNYFDLTFSVTAREMGCRIEDLGVVKIFSVGRVPTAPFLFPNISKDIVRNVLSGYDYSEDYSEIGDYDEISDKIAMDAFAQMKAGLPQDITSYGVTRGKMDTYREKLYMPCSLKAVIDLEIDVMIENGEFLGTCKRCGKFFLRGENYPYEYCSRIVPNGKTCLEIWEEEHPKPTVTDALERKCRDITDKMYARVDKTLTVKDYEYWHTYMEAMKEKVRNGEISPEELESFLDYSLEVDISKSTPIVEVPKPEPELRRPSRERVVKPFVPERISRAEIPQPPEHDPEEERVFKEGFFTSPTKQRNKGEKPQISHIIRNGESLGQNTYQKPDPAGFQPFGSELRPQTASPAASEKKPDPAKDRNKDPRSTYEDLQILEQRLDEEKRRKRMAAEEIARRRELDEAEAERRSFFEEEFPRITPKQELVREPKLPKPSEEEPPVMKIYDDIPEEMKPQAAKQGRPRKSSRSAGAQTPARAAEPAAELPKPKPAPKIIKKNAAAISAYGKAAGAPVVSQTEIVIPRDEELLREHEPELTEPVEKEPFKDIGSIFDVLESSRGDRDIPEKVTKDNAPAGIWTEDRDLFEDNDGPSVPQEPEQSELDMLKSKKQHAKSNKTRRLYDVIMREPDDNPNVRRKNKGN